MTISNSQGSQSPDFQSQVEGFLNQMKMNLIKKIRQWPGLLLFLVPVIANAVLNKTSIIRLSIERGFNGTVIGICPGAKPSLTMAGWLSA